jgi:hypothetical protein
MVDCSLQIFETTFCVPDRGVSVLASHCGILVFRNYPVRYNGDRVFPGDRRRPGRDTDPSPPSSARCKKQRRAIPLLSLRAFVAYKKGETCLPEVFPVIGYPDRRFSWVSLAFSGKSRHSALYVQSTITSFHIQTLVV